MNFQGPKVEKIYVDPSRSSNVDFNPDSNCVFQDLDGKYMPVHCVRPSADVRCRVDSRWVVRKAIRVVFSDREVRPAQMYVAPHIADRGGRIPVLPA